MIDTVKDLTFAAHTGPPNEPKRIVKPRKRVQIDMRIVVCDSKLNAWFEDKTEMGNDWDLVELVRWLRDNWPRDREGGKRSTPIMLVCHNPHKVFERLHRVFENDPEWNARFSVNVAERFHMDGTVKTPKARTIKDIRIGFFGFRDSNRKTRYFYPISPFEFMNDFRSYGETSWPEYIRLYHWGGSVRRWVKKHELRFANTRGGLAAQLLKDEKFYAQDRRKVPKLTNENARSAMPGNFYAMVSQNIGKMYGAVYSIDQKNAHHHAAETVTLPDANTLFARGRYLSLKDKPFVREKTRGFELLLKEHGLFRVSAWVPRNLGGMLPPFALRAGVQSFYVYSNELELLTELGIEIRYISHAFTSADCDTGLSAYAQWAQSEVERNTEHKQWLKPTLLSAYGMLGSRPRHIEMAYWKSEKGEPYRLLFGPVPITMKRTRTKQKIQTPIANTIHRGMIEAETRKLSIQLARKMEREGHNVIAIHADGILVEDIGQILPLLPKPWRVKDRLGGFKAIDKVSYESDTLTVMPGRKRNSDKLIIASR